MDTDPNQPPAAEPPPAAPDPIAQPPAAAAPPAPAPAPQKPRVTMPSASVAELRKKAQARGARIAERKLFLRAKALGFASVEEMVAAAEVSKRNATGAPPAAQPAGEPPAPTQQTAAPKGFAAAKRKWEQERQQLRRRIAHEEKKVRALKRKVSVLEVEVNLREQAVRAGVQDVDYALHSLRKQLAGKKADELATFDERKFFVELRKKSPHLFEAKTEPASTGHGGAGDDPPSPNAAPPEAVPPSNGSEKDARKMSSQEYNAYLQELGISSPAGAPSF